jgi:hypothetical protein
VGAKSIVFHSDCAKRDVSPWMSLPRTAAACVSGRRRMHGPPILDRAITVAPLVYTCNHMMVIQIQRHHHAFSRTLDGTVLWRISLVRVHAPWNVDRGVVSSSNACRDADERAGNDRRTDRDRTAGIRLR